MDRDVDAGKPADFPAGSHGRSLDQAGSGVCDEPRHNRYPISATMTAERMIVAPAASDASNQNPSGKRVMRFEPGSNRNVPGGKKIAWKARKTGSNATAKVRAMASAAAPITPAVRSMTAPTRRGSPRIRLALKTAT